MATAWLPTVKLLTEAKLVTKPSTSTFATSPRGPCGSTLVAVNVPQMLVTGGLPAHAVPLTSTCIPFHEPAGMSLSVGLAPIVTLSAPTTKALVVVLCALTKPFTANGGLARVAFFSMKVAEIVPSDTTRPCTST